MTDLPTPRGATVQSMLNHLTALFPRLEEILEFHGTSKQRNLRFTAYSRKEKAMEAMVERIAPRREKTLAVYGAADFPHAMKGEQIIYVTEACKVTHIKMGISSMSSVGGKTYKVFSGCYICSKTHPE
jgi:hypothetical protein